MSESRILLDDLATPMEFTPARLSDAPEGSGERLLLEELYCDVDTGLYNRRAWNEARSRVDADARTEVLFVDIVGLKLTNDILGHEAGDRLIRDVASTIARIATEMGVPGRNLWRIGGDEFVVAMSAGQAETFAEVLRKATGGRPIPGTAFTTGVRYSVGRDFSAADRALLTGRRTAPHTARPAPTRPGGHVYARHRTDPWGAACVPRGAAEIQLLGSLL